jgi:putative membrane protein
VIFVLVRPKNFNAQAFLESSCCFLFSALTLYLVTSGRYLAYVTPRMEPYLYFTAAVMLLWGWVGLRRLLIPQNKTRSAHCFVLVAPMLLLLLPHSPLSTSDLSYSLMRGNSAGALQSDDNVASERTGISKLEDLPFGGDSTPDPLADGRYGGFASDSPAVLSGLDTSAKTITVSNDEFYQWIEEMFTDPDKYAGYSIKMTGFILKDPELLQPDEFVPARLVMSCCVADVLPFGMICKYEKTEELQNEAWVTVEGVIRITEENGYREPQARITAITPATAVEGYIYPF